jgi:hypothetical protein
MKKGKYYKRIDPKYKTNWTLVREKDHKREIPANRGDLFTKQGIQNR